MKVFALLAVFFGNVAATYEDVERLFEEQKWQEAATELKDLSKAGPDRLAIQTNLAKALLLTGRREEALQVLVKELRTQRGKSIQVLKAQIQLTSRIFLHREEAQKYEDALSFIKIRNYEMAKKRLREVLQSDPTHVESWVWLGKCALELSDITLAEDAARKALTLNPMTIEGQLLVARVRLAQGKPLEAIDQLEKLEEDSEDRVVTLSEAYLLQGRLPDAIRILEKTTKANPLRLKALFTLARFTLLQAEFESKKRLAAQRYLQLILSRLDETHESIGDAAQLRAQAVSLLQQIDRAKASD